jgi:hypothetical protein
MGNVTPHGKTVQGRRRPQSNSAAEPQLATCKHAMHQVAHEAVVGLDHGGHRVD